jgi:imidazolonepropionase-like amidohydrolase/Tol biopolymer transport system component
MDLFVSRARGATAHGRGSVLSIRNLLSLSLLAGLSLHPAPAAAQDTTAASAATAKSARWDITAPHGPTRELEFETDEGTWITVDASPDGKTIVFDLLGDIYLLPIGGGEAKLLRGGPAYETQPRFSPDGKLIAFTSDRDGLENLWVMDADGGNPRQITKERERQVNTPTWTPDGQYLVGRKHFRNTRSLGAGEMWLYHLGGGSGLQLTKRRNWEQNSGEPELSRDGRYLYYSEDLSPGGGFQYNRDPFSGIYAIRRLDRETGSTQTFLSGSGGAVTPRLSPDGRTLAYIKRVGIKTALVLHDLESGRERILFDGLDHDQQEAWAIFGLYPGYSWTPDGKALIIWAGGKIQRVDAASGEAAVIPFRAQVKQTITEAVRFTQEVAPDSFDVRMLRWVTVAPDGKSVVYNALGKLWIRPLPNGTPRRLTNDESRFELHPTFAPDGRTIAYITWSDDELGAVWTVRTDGKNPRQVTTRPGHYVEPAFSPDGKELVFRRSGGDGLRGSLYAREPGIYRVPMAGGTPTLVTMEGSRPQYNRAGDRLFLFGREEGKSALLSVNLNGSERRAHLISDNAVAIIPSPDERFAAISERFHVQLAPLPLTGQPVTIGPNASTYPVTRVSRDAGFNLHWSADSRRLYWSLGPELFQRELAETFAFFEGATAGALKAAPEAAGTPIGFQAATARPSGTIALVGATVITMKGDEVLANATVIVEGNRIRAVGPSSSTPVPAGATRIDLAGKYIIPGMIDVHAHVGTGSNGITPQQHWGYYTNLAFGVTTMHDPSSDTEMAFANSELLRAGKLVGPRLFSTGTILYGAEGSFKAVVGEAEDALSHLRRMKAVGGFSVKSYNQPRRDVRQQIIAAARELEMMVVPEGGSTFFFNMTHILDGHTGVEHNIPVAPLYNDALTVFAQSKTGYTPTLIVNYGGLSGEYYWFQHTNVWENERLLSFTPRAVLESRGRRREMAAEDDYSYQATSRAARALLERGGKVQLGAHGQIQGVGAHWELWMLGQGGMTPHQALRAATLHGAEYLGLDRDLGSLEPGKLADLVVLEQNPLADLRNSESIHQVMLNGRLYDGMTLNEVAPRRQARGKFFWER